MQSTIATIRSCRTAGIEPVPATIECEVFPGQLGIHLVGCSDASTKDCLLRVVKALQSGHYTLPGRKVVINVAPGDLSRSASGYDLPIALALVAASGQGGLSPEHIKGWLAAGELGLDGSVRDIPGAVQAAEAATATGCKGVILPVRGALRAAEALAGTDIRICGVKSLAEARDAVASDGQAVPDIRETQAWKERTAAGHAAVVPTWDTLRGNECARHALVIGAAGGHHVLLAGPAGSGHMRLARALTDILPPMTAEERLTLAKVYSAADRDAVPVGRPFRNPHYSASKCALFGGGSGEDIRPGEVTLATGGVLCLDEFAECPRSTKEALRAPLEDGKVTLSRLKSVVTMPARFQLVASTPLCPCGYHGEGERCTCTPAQRAAYLGRLGGPVYDRIDIQAMTYSFGFGESTAVLPEEERSEAVSRRVARAREMQRRRLGEGRLNADMTAGEIARFCETDSFNADVAPVLERLFTALGLSVRSYRPILKVARTIADLEGSEEITAAHVAEAASYRFLDRRDALEGTVTTVCKAG